MESTFDFNNKTIHLVHTENESSVRFPYNGLLYKIEVIGVSNNKKAKEINISVCLIKSDMQGNTVSSERIDYLINNTLEYSMFYNIGTVNEKGLGFTEYMHALNGATFRTPEIKERFFNANGTLKTY